MSGLVTFSVAGTVTDQGILQALKDMMDDPGFRKGASNIWDFRTADADAVTSEGIRRFAAFVEMNRGRRGEGYKVAFVVGREVDYGLARMYEAYAGRLPFEVMVFRNMEAALAWISER